MGSQIQRRLVLGKSIPGLISLWNSNTPSVSRRGPQIVTSAAGTVPDADGNMVPWPVNHPGRGVMVQPAYNNAIPTGRENFATGWTQTNVATTLVDDWYKLSAVADAAAAQYTNVAVVGASATFSCLAKKGSGATDANTWAIRDDTAGTNLITATVNYDTGAIGYVTGSSGVTVTSTGVAGEWLISITVPWTTGNTLRVYCGFRGSAETAGEYVYCKRPMIVASSYQMPYAPPGTSVTSTAGDDDPENGMAYPMDSRMTAALSAGGRFTVGALVYMGASSAEITADTNIISINDTTTGGIYAASGGVLKAFDGVNTCTVTVAGGWAMGETLFIPWWINVAGTNQQIGYKKSAESAITWGAAASYDGSVNPGTHLRWGYTIDKPIGAIQSQVWNKSVGTDAEILALLKYAA